MNRRWLGCLIGLVCATTIGYTLSLVAATPEEVLRRPFFCPDQQKTEAKDFQVLTVRKWNAGIVALYRGQCPASKQSSRSSSKPSSSLEQVLSYRILRRNGMEWQLSGSGSHSSKELEKSKSASNKFIEYGVGKTLVNDLVRSQPRQIKRHAVFYGQVLSPTVAAVEVTFNNGKILRDTSSDGVLLLVSPNATGICDVRVLGFDNQILQRDELLSPKKQANIDGNTCQPISGQL